MGLHPHPMVDLGPVALAAMGALAQSRWRQMGTLAQSRWRQWGRCCLSRERLQARLLVHHRLYRSAAGSADVKTSRYAGQCPAGVLAVVADSTPWTIARVKQSAAAASS